MKKYELIPSDKEGLYRIKALRDFNDVMKGFIGGYIQSEHNLSHDGNCWVYDDGVVRDYAQVYGNAQIYNEAIVMGNAVVCDNVQIYDNAIVRGNARIFDNAIVRGNAGIFDNAIVRGNVVVSGEADIRGNAIIRDNAIVRGDARIFDYVIVCDNAIVRDNVVVSGEADIRGNAIISSNKDYIVFKNWWSSGRFFTWTRSNNMWKVGCFFGTGEELIAKAYEDSEESGREYERIVKYVERILNS